MSVTSPRRSTRPWASSPRTWWTAWRRTRSRACRWPTPSTTPAPWGGSPFSTLRTWAAAASTKTAGLRASLDPASRGRRMPRGLPSGTRTRTCGSFTTWTATTRRPTTCQSRCPANSPRCSRCSWWRRRRTRCSRLVQGCSPSSTTRRRLPSLPLPSGGCPRGRRASPSPTRRSTARASPRTQSSTRRCQRTRPASCTVSAVRPEASPCTWTVATYTLSTRPHCSTATKSSPQALSRRVQQSSR
mmetsp:Transcript_117626/g.312927  ORF Transcript_117626/g.312927 Transcript_117626/m.312927 type:complete len:244 (-) Transcript_117626:378-1109(-)